MRSAAAASSICPSMIAKASHIDRIAHCPNFSNAVRASANCRHWKGTNAAASTASNCSCSERGAFAVGRRGNPVERRARARSDPSRKVLAGAGGARLHPDNKLQ